MADTERDKIYVKQGMAPVFLERVVKLTGLNGIALYGI